MVQRVATKIVLACGETAVATRSFSFSALTLSQRVAAALCIYALLFLVASVVYQQLAAAAKRKGGEMRYMKFMDDSDFCYVWSMLCGVSGALLWFV